MSRKQLLWALFVIVFLALFVSSAYAVDEIEENRALLQPHLVQIHGWEQTAAEILFLNVMLGVLGVLTGLLQKSKTNWGKVATIIIGATVSIITVINNTAFDADRRTLIRKAMQSHVIVEKCKLKLQDGIPADHDGHIEWYTKFRDLLDKLNEVALGAESKGSPAEPPSSTLHSMLRGFIPELHATLQSDAPYWTSIPPKDPARWFFIGAAPGASPDSALDSARTDALSRAQGYLTNALSTPAGASTELADYILKSASIGDKYLFYDSNKKQFQVTVLMYIFTSNAQTDMKLFALEHKLEQQPKTNLFSEFQSAYPPAIPAPMSAIFLVKEKHFLISGKLGIYVSHVHSNIRTKLFLFSNLHDAHIDVRNEIGYDDAKLLAQDAGGIVKATTVHEGDEVRFNFLGNEYVLTFHKTENGRASFTVQGNINALRPPPFPSGTSRM